MPHNYFLRSSSDQGDVGGFVDGLNQQSQGLPFSTSSTSQSTLNFNPFVNDPVGPLSGPAYNTRSSTSTRQALGIIDGGYLSNSVSGSLSGQFLPQPQQNQNVARVDSHSMITRSKSSRGWFGRKNERQYSPEKQAKKELKANYKSSKKEAADIRKQERKMRRQKRKELNLERRQTYLNSLDALSISSQGQSTE